MTFLEFAQRLAGTDCPAGDFCADYLRAPAEVEPTTWHEPSAEPVAQSTPRQ